MTERVTLKPGDYVSTDRMSREQYDKIVEIMRTLGANDYHAYPSHAGRNGHFLMWDNENDIDAGPSIHRCSGRHLTVDQVLTATNAGGEPDTLTTILQSAADHDAKAKHHAAEHDRLMQQAREMLPDGWRLVRAEDMPGSPSLTIVDGQDMSDPANWREGDVVECVKSPYEGGSHFGDGEFRVGSTYKINEVDGTDEYGYIDESGADYYEMNKFFRFHHHP